MHVGIVKGPESKSGPEENSNDTGQPESRFLFSCRNVNFDLELTCLATIFKRLEPFVSFQNKIKNLLPGLNYKWTSVNKAIRGRRPNRGGGRGFESAGFSKVRILSLSA